MFRIKIKFFGRVFLLVVVSCRLDILRILFFFINNLFISIEGGLLFIGCMLILKYCLRIWFLLEFWIVYINCIKWDLGFMLVIGGM